MWNQYGGHLETRIQLESPIGFQAPQFNIPKADQLIPRAILGQKGGHSRHDIHRHILGTDRFPPQMREPKVVSHMRVSQQNAVKPGHLGMRKLLVEQSPLIRKRG